MKKKPRSSQRQVSHGAVTIATNMAGRGTDIKLDDEAKAAGGLKIIGTERHESRRIDNQLRGRAGRQGDPGESQFYISLEDDLMRLFGSEKSDEYVQCSGCSGERTDPAQDAQRCHRKGTEEDREQQLWYS